MIKIRIISDGKDVFDNLETKKVTLKEAGVVLFRLKQIERELLSYNFDNKFDIKVDGGGGE